MALLRGELPIPVKQALVVALGVLLAGGMVLLGIWQLDVYHAQGAAASARRAGAPPVPLSEVAPAGAAVGDGFGRSVVFAGHYEPRLQLLLPTQDGTPGFRVLTGFRTDEGGLVPVVRGIAGSPAAGSGAPLPPAGRLQQTGVLLPSEDSSADGPPDDALKSVRLPVLAQEWPGPFVGGFVTLAASDAERQGLAPATVQLPESSGRLRNGAYAIQWWVFAAFAVVMSVRMARDFRLQETDVTPIGGDPTTEPT